MKDGHHTICGMDVIVDNNMIVRGTKNNGTLTAYVYRSYAPGGWIKVPEISPAAFRAGVKRGTIALI